MSSRSEAGNKPSREGKLGRWYSWDMGPWILPNPGRHRTRDPHAGTPRATPGLNEIMVLLSTRGIAAPETRITARYSTYGNRQRKMLTFRSLVRIVSVEGLL